MAIMNAVRDWRKENGLSQQAVADTLHIDQSYISKIEKGDKPFPEHLDASASKMNWRIALEIIEERTGGWIRNRFGETSPNPSAIKEQLMKELREAYTALEETAMYETNREKQRDAARRAQKEIKDVLEIGALMYGTIGEIYELDKKGDHK